ncbi:MAG: hypothetical protein ACLPY1_20810 [Terracidiphilus sp.]
MQRYRLLVLPRIILAFSFVVSGSLALAATPDFTIAATNVTMSSNTSSGTGSSTFTLTSVNGYTGSVKIGCNWPDPPAGVKVPYCGNGIPVVIQPYTLTANQVVTATIGFYNAPVPIPVTQLRRRGQGLAPGLALAGALLAGFGIRRRSARWLTLTLLAVGALAGLAGIGACGGTSNFTTPGTYGYTITATDIKTNVSVTASIDVTVP